MEDNEFEEVTIISHTDHGTSLLTEGCMLRLLEKTTLEVTQQIDNKGSTKSGFLRDNSEPTLLDAVFRDIIKNEDESKRTTEEGWLSFAKCKSSSSRWLMYSKPYLFRADAGEAAPLARRLGRVYFVVEWFGNLICFPHGSTPKVIDNQGNIVKENFTNEFIGYLNLGVSTSPSHCYFTNNESQIARIDANLVETLVPNTEEVKHFQVCSLTGDLAIINSKGVITRGEISKTVESCTEDESKKYYLKQMYCGHFLSTVASDELKNMTLYLLHRKTLDSLSQLTIPCSSAYVPQLFNLLKPTKCGGQPILLTQLKSLLLLVLLGTRIHQISEIEVANYVYCLGFDQNDTWIVGSTGVSMSSVRVCLPKSLTF